MKQLLLLGAGLLGLCTLGLTSAKAGPDDYYRYRSDDDGYRRPVYHERYQERRGDDCGYRSQRRVVVREYYEQPRYFEDDCRPRHRRRHHVNFFLPFPPPPF